MLVEVREGLKINTDRIDWVSFNSDMEETTYTVCVNSRLFSLTEDEYSALHI